MKNIISTIQIFLMLIIFTLLVITNCQTTTVLEVSLHEGTIENSYRVKYSENKIFSSRVDYIDFKTSLGVKNYLYKVPAFDLSQWTFK